jgi:hypothetical protein
LRLWAGQVIYILSGYDIASPLLVSCNRSSLLMGGVS